MTEKFTPTVEQVEAVADELETARRLHQIEAEVYPFDDERPPLTEWLAAKLATSDALQDIIRAAQKEEASRMEPVKDALRMMLAFSSKDFSTVKEDAYLWSIVFGWDGEEGQPDDHGAWDDIAAKFGWDEKKIAQLKALHKVFATDFEKE